VYSFAMIIFQLFETTTPFHGHDPVDAARQAAMLGARPGFPPRRNLTPMTAVRSNTGRTLVSAACAVAVLWARQHSRASTCAASSLLLLGVICQAGSSCLCTQGVGAVFAHRVLVLSASHTRHAPTVSEHSACPAAAAAAPVPEPAQAD
jgi:hypothetical protein